MSTPYIGQIIAVGFNFTPVGYLPCDGSLVSIADYDVLFMLLGTTYGGDGVNTFGLPRLNSRVTVGSQNSAAGPSLSAYPLGQTGGVESATLLATQLPTHTHPFSGTIAAATGGTKTNDPAGKFPGTASEAMYAGTAATATLAADALTGTAAPAGGNQPHSNIQPVLALNYIIASEGIFPPQP